MSVPVESIGSGRCGCVRFLMIAPDDQVRAQQQMQEAMDIAALFGR
jgi:hypothetical protein